MEGSTNPDTYVIDASFILAWLFPDENLSSEYASYFDLFEDGEVKFVAPVLLKYEIGNAFRSLILRNRATKHQGAQLYREFLKIPLEYESIQFEETLNIALANAISFYDAAYLYVSRQNNFKLLTLDKRLRKILN